MFGAVRPFPWLEEFPALEGKFKDAVSWAEGLYVNVRRSSYKFSPNVEEKSSGRIFEYDNLILHFAKQSTLWR